MLQQPFNPFDIIFGAIFSVIGILGVAYMRRIERSIDTMDKEMGQMSRSVANLNVNMGKVLVKLNHDDERIVDLTHRVRTIENNVSRVNY